MYQPRPFNIENLTCHVCGKPAKWYDREFHSTYVLGEALCDECNGKYVNFGKASFPDRPIIPNRDAHFD
jgi:hypothetical protein